MSAFMTIYIALSGSKSVNAKKYSALLKTYKKFINLEDVEDIFFVHR